MPGKHDAYVFGDDSVFKVRPAVASATAGGPFKIRNCTAHKVAVNFPLGLIKPKKIGPPKTPPIKPVVFPSTLTIAPNSGATVRISANADGIYPYTVYVNLAPGFTVAACGESGPRIIIDP